MLRRSFTTCVPKNPYAECVRTLDTPQGRKRFYALRELGQDAKVAVLPHCLRVLLESAMRNCDGVGVTEGNPTRRIRTCADALNRASDTCVARLGFIRTDLTPRGRACSGRQRYS